jgi:hypothetical protein
MIAARPVTGPTKARKFRPIPNLDPPFSPTRFDSRGEEKELVENKHHEQTPSRRLAKLVIEIFQ